MRALLIDTETSGLVENHSLPLDKQPEVIEFHGCIADLETGNIEREYGTLIRPARELPSEITTITGIRPEDLATAPSFKAVGPVIREMIEGAPIVIAHNASFDVEMLTLEYERLGQTIKWPQLVCTVESSIYYKGYRLSLGNLYEHLCGEEFKEGHRAKSDTLALLKCAIEMKKRGDI